MFQKWLANLPTDRQERIHYWRNRSYILASLGGFVLLGTLALAFTALLDTRDTIQLEVGDVAPRDIPAPRSLTYNSEVLTAQARQQAINTVEPIYDPNPNVTREQIRQARLITTYINEVRHDSYAPLEQRVEDLLLIEALTVPESVWQGVNQLPDSRWDLISNEISALVERTMQRDIRPDNLDDTRSNMVNSVASRFSNSEAEIVVAISEDLIQPNTFFNEEQTQVSQQNAANAVISQERSFEQGQSIIRSGNIISDLDMEALRQYGLLQGDSIRSQTLLGALVSMLLTTILFSLYLDRFYPNLFRDTRMLPLLGGIFIIFLAAANVFGEQVANQPYLYPAAGMGLLVTGFLKPQLGIVIGSFLAFLVGSMQPETLALEMTTFILLGNITGILTMQRVERLNSSFVASMVIAGIAIGVVNVGVITAFALSAEESSALGQILLNNMLGLSNGFFSAGIALIALYVVTVIYNLPTSLKLLELEGSKHPLLQQLLREAPGTYQHSLQVANLSERAAEAIGADTSIVRVAAMYHDIGKMLNPFYFGENTMMGINPHNDLNNPVQSAKVIIGHVIEGDRMARRANLPTRIRDFILQHHGTTQVLFFYNKAVENAGGDEERVNIADFTYPGPPPQSRETAIMMLADGCESGTRSVQPTSKEDIENMVNTIFELRLSEGQLDESGLTLNDLKIVRHTFIETLQAMYHPRINYQTERKLSQETNPKPPPPKAILSSGIVKNLEHEDKRSTGETKPVGNAETLKDDDD